MYTIVAQKEGLDGTISQPTTYEVPYKTVVTCKDDTVYIDLPSGEQYTFVATPLEPDAQYTYFFAGWTEADGVVAGQGEWTDTWTVTAHFVPEINEYIVDWIIEGEKGTVGPVASYAVPYGTIITNDGNIVNITLPDETVKNFEATPAAPDAQYTYEFVNWTDASNVFVDEDKTVVAHFRPVVNEYTVYFEAIGNKGTVSVDKIEHVPYGTQLSDFGPTFTVAGKGTCNAVPADADDQYTYRFVEWQQYPDTVTGDTYIVAVFEPVTNNYTVYFKAIGNKGTVSVDMITDVPYGTKLSDLGTTFTVAGKGTCNAVPADADAQYTYYFVEWQEYPDAVYKDTTIVAVFEPQINQYRINAVVVTETPWGIVETPTVYTVDYGTQVSTSGDNVVVGDYGLFVPTANAEDQRYAYFFVEWTDVDSKDGAKLANFTVVENTTVYAKFDRAAIPYSVVVKYICDGAPILKDGVDIRVNSQGEYGSTYTYNYLDNPKFDDDMAAKYSLKKGYLEEPNNPTNQGETVSVTIDQARTIIVFEFAKKGAFVQFHRQDNPVANQTYETPEPYGEKHTATMQASASQPTDAGKSIKVLITDDVTGNHANGNFVGAGQTGTYNGYTYKVNQLAKNGQFDAVEIVIDGGLNVHDEYSDPLVIWYQLV